MTPRELTAAEIAERLDAVDLEPLLRGAVQVSDIHMVRETRARRAIEARRGVAYTDAEWAEAKRNLVAFFGKLAEMDHR